MILADVLFQLFTFVMLFGLIFSILYFLRAFFSNKRMIQVQSDSVESKLDRIIELLEDLNKKK
jgi:Domain of unknown function (DUF4083)